MLVVVSTYAENQGNNVHSFAATAITFQPSWFFK